MKRLLLEVVLLSVVVVTTNAKADWRTPFVTIGSLHGAAPSYAIGPEYLQETIEYFRDNYENRISRRYNRRLSFMIAENNTAGADFLDNNITGEVEIRIFKPVLEIVGFQEEHLALALCHEIGHGLAGGRRMPKPSRDIVSDEGHRILRKRPGNFVEGEADYFSVKCLNKYLDDNSELEKVLKERLEINDDVRTTCFESSDKPRCEIILQVAKATHFFLQGREAIWSNNSDEYSYFNLVEAPRIASYDQHDPMKLWTFTEHKHPNLQCRLDTFKASYFNHNRPRCWFSPIQKA